MVTLAPLMYILVMAIMMSILKISPVGHIKYLIMFIRTVFTNILQTVF